MITAQSIAIPGDKFAALQRALSDAHVWIAAANGFSKPYEMPAARMLAKERAKECLEKYFNLIEEITLGSRSSDVPQRAAE